MRTPSTTAGTRCRRALRRAGSSAHPSGGQAPADVVENLNYADLGAPYAAVGEHHVSPRRSRPGPCDCCGGENEREERLPPPPERRLPTEGAGVPSRALDDVPVRLSNT